MPDFDRKFFFVTGKGGVGKTTVSVALARSLAGRGRRVLLALTEAGAAAQMLGVRRVGGEIQQLDDLLSAVVIEPESALVEYAEMALHSQALAKASVGNRYARAFLRTVPGLYPWAVLGSAWYRSVEVVDGAPRFDSVVLDAPATGHGLEMLKVPLVIQEIAAPGVLQRDAKLAWAMFSDPAQTGVVVVSLPEDLATRESLELIEQLGQLGIAPQRVVLNGLLPQIFSVGELERLTELQSETSDEAARRVLEVSRRRAAAEAAQRQSEVQLRSELDCPLTVLPWLESAATPAGIVALSEGLQ